LRARVQKPVTNFKKTGPTFLQLGRSGEGSKKKVPLPPGKCMDLQRRIKKTEEKQGKGEKEVRNKNKTEDNLANVGG